MEVIGFPDYLIYDDGGVWSKKGKGMFLKHRKTKTGYHRVCLYRDGKSKRFYVSRLVALHYLPNPENKAQVDHINRDIDNNHVSNLRWVTGLENMQNRGMSKSNNSGHIGIYYETTNDRWRFQYRKNGYKVQENFRTKNDALWFKIIFLMELKYMS